MKLTWFCSVLAFSPVFPFSFFFPNQQFSFAISLCSTCATLAANLLGRGFQFQRPVYSYVSFFSISAQHLALNQFASINWWFWGFGCGRECGCGFSEPAQRDFCPAAPDITFVLRPCNLHIKMPGSLLSDCHRTGAVCLSLCQVRGLSPPRSRSQIKNHG